MLKLIINKVRGFFGKERDIVLMDLDSDVVFCDYKKKTYIKKKRKSNNKRKSLGMSYERVHRDIYEPMTTLNHSSTLDNMMNNETSEYLQDNNLSYNSDGTISSSIATVDGISDKEGAISSYPNIPPTGAFCKK